MVINLLHKHYNEQHLAEVVNEMKRLGTPTIRAIWSETYGEWMAIEGCHRLRAAQQLGITPIIKDVTAQKTITVQQDGENIRVKTAKFAEELENDLWKTVSIRFD